MTAGELCNREVVIAYRDTRLGEAARLMREHHVGSLVVVVDRLSERVPVGILTDRDIVVAVVAKGLDPRTLTVGDVMAGELLTVREEDGLADALRLMR
jgi:CBS domain-containing protein